MSFVSQRLPLAEATQGGTPQFGASGIGVGWEGPV